MRREYLIAIVVAALLAGGLFTIYQFFLKERLQGYAEDQLRLEQLSEKYTDLKEKFNNTKPEAVTKDLSNRVNPWKEAVEQRAGYFNIGDFKKYDPVPDDVLSYKLYYLERAPGVYNEFNEYLRNEGKSNAINVDLWFNAPKPDRVTSLQPNIIVVSVWFEAMQFGHSFIKMFVDANVITLSQMKLWESRVDKQVLKAFTAGVEFEMTMADLVVFMDKLRFDRDRFYDVNAIRITNPFLMGAYAKDPWLGVEMLVTTAEYDKNAKVKVSKAGSEGKGKGGGGLFRMNQSGGDLVRAEPKRSILDRIMRLFPF